MDIKFNITDMLHPVPTRALADAEKHGISLIYFKRYKFVHIPGTHRFGDAVGIIGVINGQRQELGLVPPDAAKIIGQELDRKHEVYAATWLLFRQKCGTRVLDITARCTQRTPEQPDGYDQPTLADLVW